MHKLVQDLTLALEHSGGTHTLEDVLAAIDKGDAQLWASDNAVVVTEVRTSPQKKTLHVWLATGRMLDVIALADRALEWGRGEGCDSATVVGRKGWERMGKTRGWHYHATIMAKEL